jgi:hypothetical protein
MTRISVHRYFFLSLLPALTWAATGLTAPVTGYVADSATPELRAIFGLPGALRYSDPLPLPRGTTRVRVAPGRDFAWVERGDAAPAVLFLSSGSVDRVAPVEGALAAAGWVAFSPGATAVVLYSSSTGRLQVLTGLPDAPRVSLDLDASTLPEQPAAAAVSDDGNILLAASRSAVYLIPPGGAAQIALSGEKIHSLAMMPDGKGAVAAEGATGSVYLLQGLTSALVARTLVSGLEGIGKVQPAWDGATVFVAQPRARTVSIVDVVTGATQSFAVDVPPVALDPLGIRDAFLISSRPGETGWIFLRNGSDARAVFVPAVASGAERGSQR